MPSPAAAPEPPIPAPSWGQHAIDVAEARFLRGPARRGSELARPLRVFETSVLIQTAKMKDFPLVLVGVDYWRPLLEFVCSRPWRRARSIAATSTG
jgi:hypothetical protein